ncbi:MAG: hypothetical protein MZV64_19725 [Ignavibacteriales bacterium]|nr:hypothetical protein [Ignavibacteriales bacterium]
MNRQQMPSRATVRMMGGPLRTGRDGSDVGSPNVEVGMGVGWRSAGQRRAGDGNDGRDKCRGGLGGRLGGNGARRSADAFPPGVFQTFHVETIGVQERIINCRSVTQGGQQVGHLLPARRFRSGI